LLFGILLAGRRTLTARGIISPLRKMGNQMLRYSESALARIADRSSRTLPLIHLSREGGAQAPRFFVTGAGTTFARACSRESVVPRADYRRLVNGEGHCARPCQGWPVHCQTRGLVLSPASTIGVTRGACRIIIC
jgi:hypothetical protein